MSWINHHNVVVPSYHVTKGKVFFIIKLITDDATASGPTSLSRNGLFTTLRSYSQFRRLWKTLCDRVNEPRKHKHLPRTRAYTCHCSDDHCDFDALYPILHSFPFPSRRSFRSKLTGLDYAAIDARRDAFAAFVTLLHDFFCSFDNGTLRNKLKNGRCLVLNTYANFLGAAEHFPTDVLHRPLVLNGWRRQRADQVFGQDKEEGNDGTCAGSVPELCPLPLSTPRGIDSCCIGTPSCTLKEEAFKQASLPALEVKPMHVRTMHSFMEEFCEHLLSHFASEIDELNSPELTQARRWEICLYVACHIGHMYTVQLLLFNYTDVDTVMADGSSCLQIAARMGRSEIVALLIEEGADINKANHAGVTSLIAACRHGCVDVVKQLLDAGAKVSSCSKRGTYPLHAAIVSQNIEIVSMLVERGANVNVKTSSGITPLHFAAKLGSLTISEYLLQHNADPEKRTKNDSDAMMIAEANGHAIICELFQRFASLGLRKQTACTSSVHK